MLPLSPRNRTQFKTQQAGELPPPKKSELRQICSIPAAVTRRRFPSPMPKGERRGALSPWSAKPPALCSADPCRRQEIPGICEESPAWGRPGIQKSQVLAWPGGLAAGFGPPSTDPDVRNGLQDERNARFGGARLSDSSDHPGRAGLPLGKILQCGKHPVRWGSRLSAGKRDDIRDMGIRFHHFHQVRGLIPHGLKRSALPRLDHTHETSRVLLREEALRPDAEKA